MPLEVRKSVEAEDDLVEIWIHSHARWGETQADRYIEAIEAALDRLRIHPSLGTDYDDVRGGYRRLTVNRHRLFYRLTPKAVILARVLHSSMDAMRWLPEDE